MRKHYFKYLFALLLFGSNGLIASLISLSSTEIVLFRTMIGSLLLLGIFLLSGRQALSQAFTFWRHQKQFACLAVSGIAMGASWMFLYEAYRQIGVSMASLAYYCGPVIVMALSPLLFGEKLTRAKIGGFATVFMGIFLVNGRVFLNDNAHFGLFCGAMSAIMYAFMVIFNKKAKDITGLENSLLQLTVSFLTVAVFVGFKQGYHITVPTGDWLPILILGMVNTGIGCYLYFSSIGHLPVQTVAICGYLEPLSAVLFSVLLLNERMSISQVIGAALIIGGAIFAEIPSKQPKSPTH